MHLNSHRHMLTSVIDLSNQIIRLAEQKDWRRLEKLDQERMLLLKEVFSGGALYPVDKDTRQQLQTIARLNDRALALCSRCRERMMVDSRKLRRGREAALAYQQNNPAFIQ